ncbi:hypothetical protein N431DRAFT_559247 [Stipitochalara longipes BDJ]|nr:hypothetical protein N431DRAFT_559247 [Stipitochalara longipes BDJ]
MGSISTACADAEAHIAKIRHDKGLIEGSTSGHNVSDLENALTTLSEQLYQSSTHFLLELIQNADDNLYASNMQPSVHFTYSNGSLRVDCNEVGFSPRNVEALCRVGQSTKKCGENATRYVGEKGIGFKSVFKAADVVWISSGPCSFKFDKNKQLGIIAPIWDAFPVETLIIAAVHKALARTLGNNYNPRIHWRSKRRTKAGFPLVSCPLEDDQPPTFSFSDVVGTFTQLLAAKPTDYSYLSSAGNMLKGWLTRPPTYHLDVKTTRGGLKEEFEVSGAMVKRARDWSVIVQQMRGDIEEVPTDVYILVRVYDVDVGALVREENGGKGKERDEVGPQMVFVVDPWDAYHKDRLLLKSKGVMVGSMA